MGYYIQTDGPKNKAKYLVEKHSALVIDEKKAEEVIDSRVFGVVCVVDNGPFEAAGFCYNKNEFEAFSDPNDYRRKTWLLMDRNVVKNLTGYTRKES